MLSYNDAAILLRLCNIPHDIQKQILLLFIGLGTHTSNIIKKQITIDDNDKKFGMFNGYLVKRIICENDEFTLWRLKVCLNKCKIFQTFTLKNLHVLYELRIAYLSNGSNEIERISQIRSLTNTLKNNRDVDLFSMFYDKDKHNYWRKPYGTQSSIVIHNAIKNGIIKEYDPLIYYEMDPDSKYY